jgi:hypothetical protein
MAAHEAGIVEATKTYIEGIENIRVKQPEPETQDTTFVDRAVRISQRQQPRPTNG